MALVYNALASIRTLSVEETLAEVVGWLRTGPAHLADSRVALLIEVLSDDHDLCAAWRTGLSDVVACSVDTATLAHSGLQRDGGFLAELMRRTGERLLPPVVAAESFAGLVRAAFRPSDLRWLERVPVERWQRLVDLVLPDAAACPSQVVDAARQLARTLVATAHEPSLEARWPSRGERFDQLHDAVRAWANDVSEASVSTVLEAIDACAEGIEFVRVHARELGATVELTATTRRALARLHRLRALVGSTTDDRPQRTESLARLGHSLLVAELSRSRIGRHIRGHTDILAASIVVAAARKGERYITTTRAAYARFFRASLLGGVIVALFASLKLVIDAEIASPLGQIFAYGSNYALCFVAIYLAGAKLATKQPAMTASALVRNAEGKDDEASYDALADTIVAANRSQFASFLGNLLAAIPVAFALIWVVSAGFGVGVSTAKAEYLLTANHLWLSATLFYAAVAGVLLFASGLASAWIDNASTLANLRGRLEQHPRLTWLAATRRVRFAAWVDKHVGAIAGNVLLGFALGAAGPLGAAFELPFDIRHIAFGAAQLGFAATHLEAVPIGLVAGALLGVLAIGFVNFIVSFGLALLVGLDARNVSFRAIRRHLAPRLWRRLRRTPGAFVLPPREPRPDTPPPSERTGPSSVPTPAPAE